MDGRFVGLGDERVVRSSLETYDLRQSYGKKKNGYVMNAFVNTTSTVCGESFSWLVISLCQIVVTLQRQSIWTDWDDNAGRMGNASLSRRQNATGKPALLAWRTQCAGVAETSNELVVAAFLHSLIVD